MKIKNFEIAIDGDYVTVYDEKGECVYEDEWIAEDFDTWAENAAKLGMKFTDYLYQVILDNIDCIDE